jgi:hypothetical protein
MLSHGTTSLVMIRVGRGRVPLHAPTIRQSIRPRHGISRVFGNIT